MEYLSKRIFPGPIMNGMLVFMADEQAGGGDAAIEFLIHEDLGQAGSRQTLLRKSRRLLRLVCKPVQPAKQMFGRLFLYYFKKSSEDIMEFFTEFQKWAGRI